MAGYVHRVAVRDRGTGVGARLLDWADGHVAGFGGDRLRLDCIAWDAPLRRYYERAGFLHVDDVALPPLPGVRSPAHGPMALARYERYLGAAAGVWHSCHSSRGGRRDARDRCSCARP